MNPEFRDEPPGSNPPSVDSGPSIYFGEIPPAPPKRSRWRLWLFVVSPFLFLGGCVVLLFHAKSSYLPAVTTASSHLHEQLARGEDADIYAATDPLFQRAMPEPVAMRFFAGVRRKLGTCQFSGPTSWSVNAMPSGTFVTVVYHETCPNGPGDETSRWKIYGGGAHLVAININSPLLLTN